MGEKSRKVENLISPCCRRVPSESWHLNPWFIRCSMAKGLDNNLNHVPVPLPPKLLGVSSRTKAKFWYVIFLYKSSNSIWLCILWNNVLYSVSRFRKLGIPHGHLADSPMVCRQYELYTIILLSPFLNYCGWIFYYFHLGLFSCVVFFLCVVFTLIYSDKNSFIWKILL